MKKKYFLLILIFLATGINSMLNAQDIDECEECLEQEFNLVCAVDSNGNELVLPNSCFAECLGLEVVECSEDPGNDWPDPCEECLEEEIDPVCATDPSGFVVELPNSCYAECLGLELVDCPDFPWEEDPWEDCDCEINPDEEWICILTDAELGIICPFPNICIAECEGYSEDDLVECEDHNPWEGDFCEECLEAEIDPVCVVDSLGFEFQLPNSCFAECFGFEVVECEFDNPWEEDPWEDCDCEINYDEEWICILTDAETGTICPFPNLCIAECEGYSEADIVECDDYGWENDPCLECLEEELDLVCAIDSNGFIIQLPNACFAECLGLELVDDCEFDNPWEDDPWEDCDCEIDPEVEWICILTDEETGLICPFPNICIAECEGYSEDDIVECEDIIIGDDLCLECLEEEFDPVCVTDPSGFEFELPNACIAECLGLEYTDCDGDEGDDDEGEDEGEDDGDEDEGEDDGDSVEISIFPNPVTDYMIVEYLSDYDTQIFTNISSMGGSVSDRRSISVTKGRNEIRMNTSELREGIYFVNILTDKGIISKKFIK